MLRRELGMSKWTVRALVFAVLLCVSVPVMAEDDKADAELALVAINVADLERSENYYGEVLGFKRVWTYPSDGNDVIEIGLAPPGGGATLVLAHFNDDPLPEGKGSYGRIIVNTANAKALAKKAEAAGSTLRWVTIPGDNPPTIVFFRDPDGYEIELYQAAPQ
ncbi:MAG: VOC family protein [Holophagales bacterium]|nr:VOC family protein [Holophagales bacterium]MYC08631.1 VOC family protein [Holophagales bacterium]